MAGRGREPADANRVTSIVAAFDRATAAVTARINDHMSQTVGADLHPAQRWAPVSPFSQLPSDERTSVASRVR